MRKMRIVSFLLTIFLFVIPTISSAADLRLNYVKQRLISSGIDVVKVNKLLIDKRRKLFTLKTVAYKEPDWKIIEKKLYSATSVQKGKDYIKNNQAAFDKAEKDFGVKKEVLAGIIAIETDFGKNAGGYSVFNVVYSRMEKWPATKWRGQADELVAFSKFCLNSQLDCFNIKGSYAGAFGIVQFMPSSVLAYGVDGDADGIIDLMNPMDAVSSAANFLIGHGWEKNQLKAIASYYGNPVGYPKIVLTYASLLAK